MHIVLRYFAVGIWNTYVLYTFRLLLFYLLYRIVLDCLFNAFIPGPIKWTFANSVDPDQTPQNAASDQRLHCLHLGRGQL